MDYFGFQTEIIHIVQISYGLFPYGLIPYGLIRGPQGTRMEF